MSPQVDTGQFGVASLLVALGNGRSYLFTPSIPTGNQHSISLSVGDWNFSSSVFNSPPVTDMPPFIFKFVPFHSKYSVSLPILNFPCKKSKYWSPLGVANIYARICPGRISVNPFKVEILGLPSLLVTIAYNK